MGGNSESNGGTEVVRQLEQRHCEEWGLRLTIGQGDVHKAFDSMEHLGLDEAL